MKYFGTNLTQAGHYLWDIDSNSLGYLGLPNYGSRGEVLPFSPEGLGDKLENGQILYAQTLGWTILAIGGSCVDKRPGCKSVFLVNEVFSKESMIESIQAIPMAMKIINQMPFKVEWDK